ncbi:MAG: DUF1573 domain-containing protein [candidate division WS1 bacterium]|nr:DUF1573 domain-containing protein [candidate division WS1 bacterium]
MADVRELGRKFGRSMDGVKASLEELGEVPGPKVIHLREPEHFTVLARASANWVQVVENGAIMVAPRADIAKRYTGQALVLTESHSSHRTMLRVSEFHYAFGVAGIGQVVEFKAIFANTGDRLLTVHPVMTTCCGAPKVEVEKEELAPGESTQVTVSFPISYSGDVFKSAQLLTTDPDQPVVFLTLHGYVPPDEKVYPDRFHLVAEKGAELTRSLRLEGPAEMDLVEAKCDAGLCNVKAGEAVVEGGVKRWELIITSAVGNRVAEFKDTLTIRTTHKERPVITVPITLVVRGDLEVQPASVFFGFAKPGAKAEREIVIRSRSGAEFKVTGATADKPGIRAGTPVLREGAWVVPVSVDTAAVGPIDGKVTVTTNVPGEERLVIAVYVHVLREP